MMILRGGGGGGGTIFPNYDGGGGATIFVPEKEKEMKICRWTLL